jgi:quercetin dioxygenase-like cupin family protein
MVIKENEALVRNVSPGIIRKHYWDQSSGTASVSMGLITLQPGTALTPHYHLVEDAMIVISGEGTFVVDGKRISLKAGDGALAPAGTVHYIDNNSNEPLVICYTWPSINVQRIEK